MTETQALLARRRPMILRRVIAHVREQSWWAIATCGAG